MDGDMQWASEPYERCFNFIERAEMVLTLSIRAIRDLEAKPQLVNMITEIHRRQGHPIDQIDSETLYANAVNDAGLARQEIAEDFQFLRGIAITSYWTALEAFVDDLLVAWLIVEPACCAIPYITEQDKKLQNKIPGYAVLEGEEKMAALYTGVKRSRSNNTQGGVSGFEDLFEIFCLKGAPDTHTANDLFESQKIRHLIVHRASIIDRKFLTECPSFAERYKVGDKIEIRDMDHARYKKSMLEYLVNVGARIHQYLYGEEEGADSAR